MRRFIVFLVLAAIALSLVAADCTSDGGGSPTLSSGIEGVVTIGPVCPVERIDTPCPDKPYQATIVIKDSSGKTVTSVESGADGAFRVALAPGTYTLHPQLSSPNTLPIAKDQQAQVRAGAYTRVTIQFDSGIR